MRCYGVRHLHKSYVSRLSQLNWDLVLNAQAFLEISCLQNRVHTYRALALNHCELVEGWPHPTVASWLARHLLHLRVIYPSSPAGSGGVLTLCGGRSSSLLLSLALELDELGEGLEYEHSGGELQLKEGGLPLSASSHSSLVSHQSRLQFACCRFSVSTFSLIHSGQGSSTHISFTMNSNRPLTAMVASVLSCFSNTGPTSL